MRLVILLSLLIFSSFVAAVMGPLEKPPVLVEMQRGELLGVLKKESLSDAEKEKLKEYIHALDFKKISEGDLQLVDKYVQKLPGDKDIANKFFGKMSDDKIKIETGKDLQWDGNTLQTRSGASIDPRELPRNVHAVREVDGKLIFTYAPIELVEVTGEKVRELGQGKPAKVILTKGRFEAGGDAGEITQPSENALFSVDEGDVHIGGVIYHPDKGKIEYLGETNFRIIDDDLHDDDDAGLSIKGKNRGLHADIEVFAIQRETFIGTTEDFFDRGKNGLFIDGNELHAKGSFDLALSNHDKDEHFAEYTFKNGILDVQGREVTDQETTSEMSIHYEKNGKEVVWNVDEDDYDVSPPGTSHPGEFSEVRRKDEKTGLLLEEPPQEAGVPLQKEAPLAIDEDQEEEPVEKKPEEKPAQRAPVQKRVQTGDEQLLANMKSATGESLIIPKDSLSEETKKNVRAKQATEFSFTAYSRSQVKKEMEANYNRLSEPEKRLADEFKKDHETDLRRWLAENMGGGVNKFRARLVGDKAVLEIHGGRSYFIFDKKYLPVMKKTLSYSLF